MSSNPVKKDFSKNQIKILKLLFEREYLQNELQKALNTTAPNLHYHLARLEGFNLIQKETLHKVGNVKINKISLNPSTREYVRKLLGYKTNKTTRSNASGTHKSGYKTPSRMLKKLKNNYYRISIIVFLLCLTGIIVSSSLLFATPIKTDNENSEFAELTSDADIFTQTSKSNILYASDYEYQWNKTWGGIYDDYIDTDNAMAIDSSNNIYLVGRIDTTGTSNYNIILIKCDSQGVEQWVKIWDGGASDVGHSVMIENTNEIYVVGMTTSYADPDGDMVIIKYDSDGNQQWNFTWGGTELDMARAIVKDSLNNYYIAGETRSFADVDGDAILVKFDSNWIEQWNVTWGGSDKDYARSMEIDSNGHICIVGDSYSADPSSGQADVMVLKYDASGTLIWDEEWGVSWTQRGIGIAIDSNNNIYFVGYTIGSDMKSHLVKYDTNGNYQWERIWGVNGVYGNTFRGLIIDSNDEIFISGFTSTHGPYPGQGDAILLNYDTLGNQNWYKAWGTPDDENTICINMDSNHNLYLAGNTESAGAGGLDIFLMKYLLEYEELSELQINVYDYSVAIPFLRLGLYEFTYDLGGYLSEIYLRFNLTKIEKINSIVLKLSYWEGYPIESDNYYEVNVSLVCNDWVEETTTWTEKPECLGTSTILYLHNPNLESDIYLDLTSLVEGITDTLVTFRLCPNNLSRIRFPAPFKSSESYGITPRLILEYTTTSQAMFPNKAHISLIILLVVFGSLTAIALSGILYKISKQKVREIPAVIIEESAVSIRKQESPVINLKQEDHVTGMKQESAESIIKQVSPVPPITRGGPIPMKTINKRLNICPECGTSNLNEWNFCTSCGKEIIKTKRNSINMSDITSGLILSILGGLSSILLGFWLELIVPNLSSALEESFIIIRGITIIGGIITLIGTAIVPFYIKVGKTIILISGIVAGGNLITIFGAISISKKLKRAKLN